MNRHTRALVLFAASASLIAAAPLGPATAAGTDPVIKLVAADPERPEIVKATVTSSDSVVKAVTLVMQSGDPEKETRYFEKQGTSDLWVSEPLRLPKLGTGTPWKGTVTATEADGGSSTAIVEIDYRMVPRVKSFDISTEQVGFERPTVTATGKITARDPRDGTTVGADGLVALSLTSPGGGMNSEWAYTRSDGTFTVAAAPGEFSPGDTLSAVLQWSGNTGTRSLLLHPDGTQSAVIGSTAVETAKSFPSRVRLDAATVIAAEPDPAVIKGVVERRVGDQWLPVPGVRLTVDVPFVKGAGAAPFSVSTGADGRFSAPVTTKVDIPDIPIFIDDPVLGAYLQAAGDSPVGATASVDARRKVTVTWSSRVVSAKSKVTVSGTAKSPLGVRAKAKVYLQSSANGTTSWKNVGYVTTSSTGTYDKAFALANADVSRYYRLFVAGDGVDLQDGATKAYRLSRHASRITKAKTSPTALAKGKTVKVSGVLQKESGGSFVNLGKNKVIRYYFQPKGSTKNTYLGSSKTTSTGSFSKSFKATKDGSWFAVWRTTSDNYVDAYGALTYVDVK